MSVLSPLAPENAMPPTSPAPTAKDAIRVVSFDVFETLLVRKVGDATAIFFDTARECADLLPRGFTPKAWRAMRVQAEWNARNVKGAEVTLAEIFKQLALLTGWEGSLLDRLMEVEVRLETDDIEAIPGARIQLEEHRLANRRIVFTSDMYLPSAAIEKMLRRHGFWKQGDRLFVSGEIGASKRSGELFAHLCKTCAVEPAEVLHLGNCRVADFEKPRAFGLGATHLPAANLNGFERTLEKHADATEGFASLLAGASRCVRLENLRCDPHQRALREVACGVVAPLFIAFTIWALLEAEARRLHTLYWISRDGYIPSRIADRLAESLGLQVRSRYLFGSRRAFNASAVTHLSERQRNWVIPPIAPAQTIAVILDRLNLDRDAVDDLLTAEGFGPESTYRPLSEKECDHLWESVLTHPEFSCRLRDAHAACRIAISDYLRGAGLLEDVRWALVDIGWQGRAQEALNTFLEPLGGRCRLGLYFGLLRSDFHDLKTESPKIGFLFDRRFPVTDRFFPGGRIIPFVETMATAPHGSVVGFKPVEGKTEPVFAPYQADAYTAWGQPIVVASVEACADRVAKGLSACRDVTGLAPMVHGVLSDFFHHPTPRHAAAWGAAPYEDAFARSDFCALAAPIPLSPRHVARCLRSRGELPKPHPMAWDAGCLALSSSSARFAYRALRKLGGSIRAVEAGFAHVQLALAARFRRIRSRILRHKLAGAPDEEEVIAPRIDD